MRKIFILIISSLFTTVSFAQFTNNSTTGNASTLYHDRGGRTADGGFVNTKFADTVTANTFPIAGEPGAQIQVGNTIYHRDSTATKWLSGGALIAGGAITSIPSVGFNPGTGLTSDEFIINTFYQSQVPTATLTGGQTLEFRSAQTMNYTLNWTAGRQGATDSIASVVVNGIPQSFSQPAAGSTVSGTQAVSFPANTDITYSIVVTTTDGKSSTSTTKFSFLPERYFGWISDTTGIGSASFDDSKITALSNELSASKVKGGNGTWNTGNPTGTQFYVYAYYATAGELSHFDMNGFPSLEAMNHVTRNFTNALGFTGQWIIYWNKNGQTLSSDIIAN